MTCVLSKSKKRMKLMKLTVIFEVFRVSVLVQLAQGFSFFHQFYKEKLPMKNYQAFKRPIFWKTAKNDDILFGNMFSKYQCGFGKSRNAQHCQHYLKHIINSIELFQGLPQGRQFKGSYLGSSVIGLNYNKKDVTKNGQNFMGPRIQNPRFQI